MKQFTQILQHPLIKLLVAPIAFILFGVVLGAEQIGHYQWMNIAILYLMVAILEVISHFFYVRYDQNNLQQSPSFILIGCETILILLIVAFIITQHWIISLLVILATAYKHLVYFPQKFSNNLYHSILNIFFNAFIWNVIAYFSQSAGVHSDFLLKLIPLVLTYSAVELEQLNLRQKMLSHGQYKSKLPFQTLEILLALNGLAFGVYFSLPSKSYYIVQALFIFLTGLSFMPIIVKTKGNHQTQNKLNYASSFYFLFTFTYLLSYLF